MAVEGITFRSLDNVLSGDFYNGITLIGRSANLRNLRLYNRGIVVAPWCEDVRVFGCEFPSGGG